MAQATDEIQASVTGKNSPIQSMQKTFGEFLCDGPAGCPDETSFEAFLAQREDAKIRRGTFEEWMPHSDKRPRALRTAYSNDWRADPTIPRLQGRDPARIRQDGKADGKTFAGIASGFRSHFSAQTEKLAGWLTSKKRQRKLAAKKSNRCSLTQSVSCTNWNSLRTKERLTKNWPGKVRRCFSVSKSEWGKKAALGDLGLRPLPDTRNQSTQNFRAKRLLAGCSSDHQRIDIVRGIAISLFHARLIKRDAELLQKLGSSSDKPLALFDDHRKKMSRAKRQNTKTGKRDYSYPS